MRNGIGLSFMVAAMACAFTSAANAGNVAVTHVSHAFVPGQITGGSVGDLDISDDGNFIAFDSTATNLINPPDPSSSRQVYVYSRATGVIERISHDALGNRGNGGSDTPRISADGRYVAFASSATNLVAGDTNGFADVFVYDRQLGTTKRVSIAGSTQANGHSSGGLDISADGQTVAFASYASNLVAGDTNSYMDVFVYNSGSRALQRVSVGVGGQANWASDYPVISGDGLHVAFRSGASNLVSLPAGLYSHAYLTGPAGIQMISVTPSGGGAGNNAAYPGFSLNYDGSFMAFPDYSSNLVSGDVNAHLDAFVRDVSAGATYLSSISTSGAQAGNDVNQHVGMSGDGRFVSFTTSATNFLSPDANGPSEDVFVRDRLLNTLDLVSQNVAGVQANGGSDWSAMSADGRFIVFRSSASNLDGTVDGDTLQAYLAQRW